MRTRFRLPRLTTSLAFVVGLGLGLGSGAMSFASAEAGQEAADLVVRLHQPHAASADQVRAVLKSIHAEVPNAKGTFEVPARSDKPAGDLDWLPALEKLPAAPARDDAVEVVSTLRALAVTKSEAAAEAILDFGFTPEGLVYRDECGRLLRTLSPYSLATLLRASQDRKRDGGNYARYANYQLDRLSMNRPSYALGAAPNDAVEVAILKAIGDVKHPDAVTAVLDRVDAPAHSVRNAARAAWMAYVTGPEPPPAPKEFRKLAGGKKSKDKMPLYLTYRELADQELRRVLFALQGSEPAKNLTPEQMTKVLFDLYDRRHAEKGDAVVRDAVPFSRDGKWDEVAARYDALLHDDPLFAHRATMVPGYLEIGAAYAKEKKWEQAILAFDKALTLDPDGDHAKEASAGLVAARAARDHGPPPPHDAGSRAVGRRRSGGARTHGEEALAPLRRHRRRRCRRASRRVRGAGAPPARASMTTRGRAEGTR
jgi:tetratricopeptide (TPR) repeat protein